MLITAVVVSVAAGLAAVAAYIGLRFPGRSRDALFVFTGWLQGLETKILYNVDDIVAVLSHGEDKGRTLEETLMLPVWTGAASVESVNGQQWRRLRASFNCIHSQLPSLQQLETIFLTLDVPAAARAYRQQQQQLRINRNGTAAPPALASTNPAAGSSTAESPSASPANGTAAAATGLQQQQLVVDSPLLSRLVITGFLQWLMGAPPSANVVTTFYNMMVEIRGEVAMRRRGDDQLKLAGNETIVRLLEQSAYHLPPGATSWSDRDVFPAVLQPYVISPAVNIPDVFIALSALCPALPELSRKWQSEGYAASRDEISAHLYESMRLKHPFPVLERLHGRVQYFMPLDSLFPPGEPAAAFRPEWWLDSGGRLRAESKVDMTAKPSGASEARALGPEAAGRAPTAHAAAAAGQAFNGRTNEPSRGGLPVAAAHLPFGVGPRRCPGKAVAMTVMSALLYNVLGSGLRFEPERRHQHSGRLHDDAPSPVAERLHMLSRILWALLLYAFTKRSAVL